MDFFYHVYILGVPLNSFADFTPLGPYQRTMLRIVYHVTAFTVFAATLGMSLACLMSRTAWLCIFILLLLALLSAEFHPTLLGFRTSTLLARGFCAGFIAQPLLQEPFFSPSRYLMVLSLASSSVQIWMYSLCTRISPNVCRLKCGMLACNFLSLASVLLAAQWRPSLFLFASILAVQLTYLYNRIVFYTIHILLRYDPLTANYNAHSVDLLNSLLWRVVAVVFLPRLVAILLSIA